MYSTTYALSMDNVVVKEVLFNPSLQRYSLDGSGSIKVTSIGFWERIGHLNENFLTGVVNTNANVLENALKQKHLTPLDSQDDRDVDLASAFKNSPLSEWVESGQLSRFSDSLTAARLGLTTEQLKSAEGLSEFANKRLYMYLARYGDTLRVNEKGAVEIRYQGKFTPWSEIPAEIRNQDLTPSNKKDLDNPWGDPHPWPYGPNGLMKDDMDTWDTLPVMFKEDPKRWGGGYAFSIATNTGKHPDPRTDHSWIRLMTPEGDVYSVKFDQPDKMSKQKSLPDPIRVKQGKVRLDCHEFISKRKKITEVIFATTPEGFQAMKAKVEEDHRKGILPYNLIHRNCAAYSLELARLGGVQLEAKTSFTRLALPSRVAHVLQRCFKSLPTLLQNLVHALTSLVWNLIQVWMGATKVDKKIQSMYPDYAAPFSSLWHALTDIWHCQEMRSPWSIGYQAAEEIESLRKAKLEKLTKKLEAFAATGNESQVLKTQKKIDNLHIWCPRQYRVQAS